MSCDARNFSLPYNNTTPIGWAMLDGDILFPLAGSVFVLTVYSLVLSPIVAIITLNTDTAANLTIDLPTSTVNWVTTLAEANAIPAGECSRYTLDRLIDSTRRTLVSGLITGTRP